MRVRVVAGGAGVAAGGGTAALDGFLLKLRLARFGGLKRASLGSSGRGYSMKCVEGLCGEALLGTVTVCERIALILLVPMGLEAQFTYRITRDKGEVSPLIVSLSMKPKWAYIK